MAMEVLRPHDCLLDQFRTHPFPRRRGGGRSGRKQVNNVLERKRCGPVEPRRLKSADNLRSSNYGGGLISGQVRILKRGESLDSSLEKKKKKNEAAVMLCGVARLGPDPDAVPREEMKAFLTGRRAGYMYAGSAFVASPSPRDLPVPSFSQKKLELHFSPAADDSATRDLRRLLGLK